MMNDKALTLRGKKAVWAPGGGTGPIDPKRLPEGYPYKEGEAVEWDGNTNGLATATVEGMTLYKVSDKVLTSDNIVGMDVFFSGSAVENGLFPNQVTVDSTMIDEKDDYVAVGVRVASGAMVFIAIASFPAAISENMPAGTYVGRLDEGEVSAYVSKFGSETIHPMAPEFLPAGVGGGGLLFEVADDELEAGSSSAQQIVTKNYDPLYEALMKGQSVVIKMSLGGEPALIVPSVYMVQSGTGLFAAIPDATITFTNGSYH